MAAKRRISSGPKHPAAARHRSGTHGEGGGQSRDLTPAPRPVAPVPEPVSAHRRALEARAWELRSQGIRAVDMVDYLTGEDGQPISVSYVYALLKSAETRFDRDAIMPNVAQVRQTQLAQLEYVVAESLEAWRKSKLPGKSASQHVASRVIPESAAAPGQAPVKGKQHVAVAESTSQYAQEREGNPKYLESAMAAMDRIRRLTGADAPLDIRFGASGQSDVPLEHFEAPQQAQYLRNLARAALIIADKTEQERPDIIDVTPEQD